MAAAAGWLRRVAAATVPRIPCGIPALPSAAIPEAPALALPARAFALELMAVPKKKVRHLLLSVLIQLRGVLPRCGVVVPFCACGDLQECSVVRTRCSLNCSRSLGCRKAVVLFPLLFYCYVRAGFVR
uniref:Uncharacterized protein n=1 Tax=Arundo donax TaxID=35708 RepID=A0A0A9D4M8_ARUDO